MAIRTNHSEVKKIIDTDVGEDILRAHIEVASHLIDDILGSSSLSAARLKDIELYLSAHFTAIYIPADGLITELKMGDTTETYADKALFGKGLELTRFGQQALSLDTTGGLAALGRRAAKFSVFGHVPP